MWGTIDFKNCVSLQPLIVFLLFFSSFTSLIQSSAQALLSLTFFRSFSLFKFRTMKKSILVCAILIIFSACSTVKSYEIGQILTPKGEIWVWLYEETPNHKESFMQLANAGYWDSLSFNRVIPDFLAQAGCPDTPEGFNDPEYLLEPDFNDKLTHTYGAFGAGRDGNPNKLYSCLMKTRKF